MSVNHYDYNDSTQLSPHFNAREFRCSCGKSHETLLASELVDKLESLYTALNCSKIIVTSGYRCPEHDKAVGGTSSGQHIKGTAADVCCYGQDGQPISSKTVCCKAQDLGFGGIANITSSYQYTHLDVRTGYRWLGDETKGNGTVTDDFYKYFGISKTSNFEKNSAIFGIDVSEWQGTIDWAKAKAGGIKFAILRAGISSRADKCFTTNYAACENAGIPVGSYWYCTATTVADAKAQAKQFLQVISGKKFAYPVYMDLEEPAQFALGKAKCSELVDAFLTVLEQARYFAGLYCSTSYLQQYLTDSIRSRYAIWVAQYYTSCTYDGDYGIWQYNVAGNAEYDIIGQKNIPGVSGECDMDYCYTDYPSIIKNAGLNGFAKNATTTPEDTKKDTSDTEKDTSDNDTLKQILQHVSSIDKKLQNSTSNFIDKL